VHSGGSPNLLFPEVVFFHSFYLLMLRDSVLFPHPIPDHVLLSPHTSPPPNLSTLLPRSLPPSPLVIAFFSLPSGTEASSPGHFSLLNFLSSVDCILGIRYFFFSNMHLLASTCHVHPSGLSYLTQDGILLVPSICLHYLSSFLIAE
jgi:hypothetical protein